MPKDYIIPDFFVHRSNFSKMESRNLFLSEMLKPVRDDVLSLPSAFLITPLLPDLVAMRTGEEVPVRRGDKRKRGKADEWVMGKDNHRIIIREASRLAGQARNGVRGLWFLITPGSLAPKGAKGE